MSANDPKEQLWQQVYDARQAAYEQVFGKMGEMVQKLMNLTGVWPGGCLVDGSASKLAPGAAYWSSFGLSNPDMPASSRATTVKQDATGTTVNLQAREPRKVPAGLAGYGFEIVIVTPDAVRWPLHFLNWAVPLEILDDVDFLDRIMDPQTGGLTVEAIAISKTKKVDFLIEPGSGPIPPSIELPNGKMHFLVATAITHDEMNWALKNGRKNLADKLVEKKIGQISFLERKSVI